MSFRRAGELAGISASRWQQIEQGYEIRGGMRIPVSTTEDTLSRMAHAVGLDPVEIVALAGMDPTQATRFDEPSTAVQQARQMLELAEQMPPSDARDQIISDLRRLLFPPEEPPLEQPERPRRTG